MNVFEMVVIIVALGVVSKIAIQEIKSRRRHTDENFQQQSDERISMLEERIKVLERIVTSDRYDLNQQFKNLDD